MTVRFRSVTRCAARTFSSCPPTEKCCAARDRIFGNRDLALVIHGSGKVWLNAEPLPLVPAEGPATGSG